MTAWSDHLLRIARWAGLFALARLITARRLRILGYHGISLADESDFRPMLFMRASTFAARLDALSRSAYPVLSLDDALRGLKAGTLPPCAVVITIDDAWYGTFRTMVPELERQGFPATLYVPTLLMESRAMNFSVAAAYALWRGRQHPIDLRHVHEDFSRTYDLTTESGRDAAAAELTALADDLPSPGERQALLSRLFAAVGVDFDTIARARMFAFMTPGEASTLPARGISLQLHTHSHRFPSDCDAVAEEIEQNRKSLELIAAGPFPHLCYPSGNFDRNCFPRLMELNIKSGTTTILGTNTANTSTLELRRILDSDSLSEIRFEAEMSGLLDILRRLMGRA